MTIKHQPLGPNQTKWIEALESGDYNQGREALRVNDNYCCLGVGSEVLLGNSTRHEKDEQGIRYFWGGNARMAPRAFMEEVGLYTNSGGVVYSRLPDQKGINYVFNRLMPDGSKPVDLVTLNDDGYTFSQIAAHLRKWSYYYFKETL